MDEVSKPQRILIVGAHRIGKSIAARLALEALIAELPKGIQHDLVIVDELAELSKARQNALERVCRAVEAPAPSLSAPRAETRYYARYAREASRRHGQQARNALRNQR